MIAAASGRALATAARRAGYRPLVVDFFDDEDTRSVAAKTRRVRDPERGFVAAELLALLDDLAEGGPPCGLVYGSGFEDRAEILDVIALKYSILGNSASLVARAKNPRVLAALCAKLAIPHPEIAFELVPDNRQDWLVKRHGGGGGIHIRPADEAKISDGEYFQRRVSGEPVSVLLLGDGRRAQIVGTSSQWTAPASAMPFRFGGAVRPAQASNERMSDICIAAQKLVQAFGLAGLCSVDFIAGGGGFHLLEVNPRPGATLDVFADAEAAVFAAHLAACRGHLPGRPLIFTRAAATAIAYAPCEIPSMPALTWPDWCKDRQRAGTPLRAGDPVCTILAEAETAEAARNLVAERRQSFESGLLREAHKECVG